MTSFVILALALSVVLCSVTITCNEKLLPPIAALQPMAVIYGPSAHGENVSASTAMSIRYDLRSGSSSISAKCELNTDDQLCVWGMASIGDNLSIDSAARVSQTLSA